MKKLLIIFMLLMLASVKAFAISFADAYAQCDKKPMLVLLYAEWADNYEGHLAEFRKLKSEYGKQFNFVELDIASQDAHFFNTKYHIYPNLPYVLMYKDGGKISRYIQRDCAASLSCMESRVKTFIQ